MALTVPLLLLCLVSPPGTHAVAAMVAPRAGLVGLPGSEQGVLSGRLPFNLLLSVRRDDRGRTAPAAHGQLGATVGGGALRALARLVTHASAGGTGRDLTAEPRGPPAR
jgi:hypothetical protein